MFRAIRARIHHSRIDTEFPKIILVTDRTDLDRQITGTFRKCGRFVQNATTGQRLVELLENKGDSIVTTIINKFVAAMKKIKKPLDSHDIFVLVDASISLTLQLVGSPICIPINNPHQYYMRLQCAYC